MRRPGILEGAGVALVAGIGGGVSYNLLSSLFLSDFLLRLLIAVTGLFYVLYLLRRSGERVGRITCVGLWSVSAVILWVMGLSLPLYLLAHLGLVWMIRSLYYYSSLISAIADFGLVLFGLAAGVWAVLQTGSLFLCLWCFFLVQALFVLIPASWQRSNKPGLVPHGEEDLFQDAYRMAETALTRLSTRR